MAATTALKRKVSMTHRSSPVIYSILKWIISGLVHLLYQYRVQGSEHVPPTGRVILIVNHLHLLDPAAVMPAIPRKIVTMAKTEYRVNMLWGLILRLGGVIFVRRGEADRDALRASYDVLTHEGCLAIAPEGTRSKTGTMQQAKPGVAYIAARTNTPIVPVAIWGIENLRQWRLFKRPELHVAIGRPFYLPKWQEKTSTDELQHAADLAMIRLGTQLPERYRGVYAERIAAVENGTSSELDALIDV